MVKALKNARQLKDATAIKGWLSKILANCWYDYLRTTKETIDLDNLPYEESSSEGDEHEQQDIVSRVRAMIATLPVGQRQVITLRDVEGVSAEEVCNILSISETNQRVLLHRARTKVRRVLDPYVRGDNS